MREQDGTAMSDEDLRKWLGGHQHRPGLSPAWLHKEEVFSLVIRAGRKAGFRVQTEIPVPMAKRTSRSPTIDCGWFLEDRLIVAWEIDGRAADKAHFEGTEKRVGNLLKFNKLEASFKYQVLYSLGNNLEKRTDRSKTTKGIFRETKVVVIMDEELMRPGKIERIIDGAKAAAKR